MADSNTPLAVRVGQFGDCGCVLEGREVGLGLKQCPTHAAAPSMETLLRDLVRGYDAAHTSTDDLAYFEVLAEAAINARPLLASIDQEKA